MRAALGALVLAALTSCTPATERSAYAAPPGERQPVILELFTSEGCSSCPPADTLLASLSRGQPVPGADIIALELHVDYWDDLGWADPFSSAAHSARQRAYGVAFNQRGIYTPQLVVDGHAELLGSSAGGAKEAIAAAAHGPKARVAVTQKEGKLVISVADLPGPREPATGLLAITEESLHTPRPRPYRAPDPPPGRGLPHLLGGGRRAARSRVEARERARRRLRAARSHPPDPRRGRRLDALGD